MSKRKMRYENITSDMLIHYIEKELQLRSSQNIDTTSVPLQPITNDWEHFNKAAAITRLLPYSFSYELNARRGRYGIYRVQPSTFTYQRCTSILRDVVNYGFYDVAAHVLQPRYRNHFTHSFLVGALGWWMLHNVKYQGIFLKKWYEEFIARRYRGRGYDLWDIWWLVALLHDIGYPLSLFWKRIPMLLSLCYNYPLKNPNELPDLVKAITESLLSSPFGGLLPSELKRAFEDFHKNVMEKLINRVYGDAFDVHFREDIDAFYNGYKKSMRFDSIPIRDETKSGQPTLREMFLKYVEDISNVTPQKNEFKQLDHGIASALLCSRYYNNYSNLKDDSLAQLIFTPVAFHSLQKVSKENDLSFDIKEDFDVFFLRLVDQLQEWGRGILIERTNEILIESKGIRIGGRTKYGGVEYTNLEDMQIVFPIVDLRNVLTKSGWSFQVIKEDKRRAFNLLKIAKKSLDLEMQLEVQSTI